MGKQGDIFTQTWTNGSLTLEEALDETSRSLADARKRMSRIPCV